MKKWINIAAVFGKCSEEMPRRVPENFWQVLEKVSNCAPNRLSERIHGENSLGNYERFV